MPRAAKTSEQYWERIEREVSEHQDKNLALGIMVLDVSEDHYQIIKEYYDEEKEAGITTT